MPTHIKPKPKKMQTFWALRYKDGKYLTCGNRLVTYTSKQNAKFHKKWLEENPNVELELVKITPKEVR